jgi:hypothetical protein
MYRHVIAESRLGIFPRNIIFLILHKTKFRRNFSSPRSCFVSFRWNFVKNSVKRNEILLHINIYIYKCVCENGEHVYTFTSPWCTSLLHVRVAFHCCFYIRYVHAACLCCLSLLQVRAAGPCLCLFYISMLHVHAACQRCMSMLHGPAECPRCLSVL